jgi:hypothetical protein
VNARFIVHPPTDSETHWAAAQSARTALAKARAINVMDDTRMSDKQPLQAAVKLRSRACVELA